MKSKGWQRKGWIEERRDKGRGMGTSYNCHIKDIKIGFSLGLAMHAS